MRPCSIRCDFILSVKASKRPALRPPKLSCPRSPAGNASIALFRTYECPVCRALIWSVKVSGVSSPVILITGHGDVDMAVAAIKVGAFDFIEKPFDEVRLLDSIRNAMAARAIPEADAIELEKLQARFDTLSTRQRQVMEFAVAGLSNKEIASKLKISPKTVENHRAWVMEGIGARNIADLVRIAMEVEDGKDR